MVAQAIQQSAIYRQINKERSVRLSYENDYFTASDRYYTQGINLEIVNPGLRANPLNYLLLKPRHFKVKYGLCLEHNGYTPSSIRHAEVLLNDHPFAACLMLKSVVMASNPEKGIRVVSSLSTGVMGPIANGACMQISIHKWTNNIQPLGWENQVKNDIILNYQVNFDKNIYTFKKYLSLIACGEIRAGTLSDRAGAGVVIMAGKLIELFDKPVDNKTEIASSGKMPFHISVFMNPTIHAIGYNASLQGGFFNKDSPFVLKQNEIEHLVLTNNMGITLSIGNVFLEYFQTIQTKEFKSGLSHKWGGLKIGVGF